VIKSLSCQAGEHNKPISSIAIRADNRYCPKECFDAPPCSGSASSGEAHYAGSGDSATRPRAFRLPSICEIRRRSVADSGVHRKSAASSHGIGSATGICGHRTRRDSVFLTHSHVGRRSLPGCLYCWRDAPKRGYNLAACASLLPRFSDSRVSKRRTDAPLCMKAQVKYNHGKRKRARS